MLARLALLAVLGVLALTTLLVLPWRWLPPPTSAFMLGEIREGGDPAQRWVPLEAISPDLALCVIAAEDQKFPVHSGFDFESIASALREGPRPRGASTLSQQLAKNLYLWPGRSLLRKGLEAWFTVALETLWPKRRILEVYLNVAEFGPGIYGAAEASERFFGVAPRDLSLHQAALLTAVLPNPRRMSVADPSPYVRRRAAEIVRSARGLGTGHLAEI